MKTGYKVGKRVAISLFAVGIILVIIATMMGASWHDATVSIIPGGGWGWLRNNNSNSNRGWGTVGMWYNDDDDDDDTSGSHRGKIFLNETYTDVTSLQFNFESAEVEVEAGDTFAISVSGSGEKFTSNVTNGVWEIYSEGYKTRWGKDDRYYTVKITLPKDFAAKRADIYVGMGSMDVDRLNSIESYINVGMGEIDIDNLIAQDADIICGMGTINIDGNLIGETTIECGMGDVEVGLVGKEEDYGYTASVGMGEIHIGKHIMLDGIAGDGSDGADRPNQLNIDCGMGSVDVSFDKD